MARPPGFATQRNRINEAYKSGNITKEERNSFIEDLKVFADDGKISAAEKGSIAEEIGISTQQNAPKPPSSPLPPPDEQRPPPHSGWEPEPEPDPIVTIPPQPPPPPPPTTVRPAPTPSPPTVVSPPPPPPAPPALPELPQPTSFAVKQAEPDIIIFDEQIDPDFIVESFFEEFGGTELIKISRSDLIFSPKTDLINIKNIEDIQQRFSPKNLIPIKSTQENFTKYGIDLFKRNVFEPYFDNDGSLVIEIGIVRSNEVIDVEVVQNGTIDEVDET